MSMIVVRKTRNGNLCLEKQTTSHCGFFDLVETSELTTLKHANNWALNYFWTCNSYILQYKLNLQTAIKEDC